MCLNKDQKYFAINNGKIYCRKCILVSNSKKAINLQYKINETIKAKLNYKLTKAQNSASEQIFNYVINNKSVIVNAVCGAGKTELVYKSIEHYLNHGLKVAFAIPRKDVVIEIFNRLKNDYPSVDVISVYGGHNQIIEGQLIVLTTHQLFRYDNYFDLLVLDEADAFPYYDNELLNTFLKRSVKGPIIYLSATIKDSYKKECKNIVYVNKRFHNHDLPIPIIKKYNFINKIEILKSTINSINKKPLLIFVPTILEGKKLSKILNIPFVYSSYNLKQKYIDLFKSQSIKQLITTSILERGITLKNVQVIVYDAHHSLYDEASLIQISGRVGRKKESPTGKIYFLCKYKTRAMKLCIKELIKKNKLTV